MKLKQVFPKPNNTSIIIYYSDKGTHFRYPTGISITNELKNGKYSDWDYKLNMLKPYVSDFETKKKAILDVVKKANEILSQHFEAGKTITPDELKNILSSNQLIKTQSINSLLRDHYEGFYQLKKEGFDARGADASLKDFTSTKHLLEAYEIVKKKKLKVSVLGEKIFLYDLINFMRTKQPKTVGDVEIKFQGGLNEKTIKKRMDVLVGFAEYLKELKLLAVDGVDALKRFRRVEVTVIQGAKETLTIPEVHKLYNYHFENKKLEQIRDVFVFLCFTGIRFQDLVEFDKKFIKNNVYIKKASKTGIDYIIPLSEIVQEILVKYKYQLPVISNVKSNLYIKEALEATGLFDDYTEQIDKTTGKYKQRFDAITMHKGRDTFITNLVDTVPLNEIMKYTGHKKLSTLQGYIDKKRNVSKEFIKIFNQ